MRPVFLILLLIVLVASQGTKRSFRQDNAINQYDYEEDHDEFSSFLDELTRVKKGRVGRRRKLTSHEQGLILVEALGKRQINFTGYDRRGHQSADVNVHNGIMDMLGRSRFLES